MFSYFKNKEPNEMDSIEAEVDAIRKKLWEEIKDMTPDEHVAYFERETADVRKQFNIKTSRLKPAKLVYTPRVYEDYASL